MVDHKWSAGRSLGHVETLFLFYLFIFQVIQVAKYTSMGKKIEELEYKVTSV